MELMQTDDVSTIAAQIANQAELIYQAWKTTDLNPSELIQYHSVTPDRSFPLRHHNPHNSVSPNIRIPIRNISPAPLGASPAFPRRVIEIPITTDNSFSESSPQQQISPKNKAFVSSHPQHQGSPARSLNVSPRPFVASPGPTYVVSSIDDQPDNHQISRGSNHNSNNKPQRSYSPGGLSTSGRNLISQPPPPPERYSSYPVGESQPPHQQLRGGSATGISLRDLVTNFVLEDKARNSRPQSIPSTIQDALQKFEHQMAITSRAGSPAEVGVIRGLSSSPTSSSHADPQSFNSISKSDLHDNISRRSVSPNPLISQPGWNESSQSNTSTWPLKNKQANSVEIKRMSSPTPKSYQPTTHTNYITTLEARVDDKGNTPNVPIRHKVIAINPTCDKEEENLIQALRHGTFIEDGDSLRRVPNSSYNGGDNMPCVSSNNRGIATRPKYSISVTVDVESNKPSNDLKGNDPRLLSSNWTTSNTPENIELLSTVDYAKARYYDAQTHPRTTQRMEDYKSYSAKSTTNTDGRVMQAKSRFEVGPSMPEIPWRNNWHSNDLGSSLSDFYRRKIRKSRKAGSPEPINALATSLPHPELTDQQKAHIRERTLSPSMLPSSITAVRPFLTQGSVAERVLLFEKAPKELQKSATPVSVTDKRKPAFSSWRDPDEVRTKAQDFISSPQIAKQLESALSSSAENDSSFSYTPRQNHLREPSLDNKENTRPIANALSSTTSVCTPSPTTASQIIQQTQGPMSPIAHNTQINNVAVKNNGVRRSNNNSSKDLLIPRFYYPMGKPCTPSTQEQQMQKVAQCFRNNGNQITRDVLDLLVIACDLPLYWKEPLFIAAGGEKVGYLTHDQFSDYWNRLTANCHDHASKFVHILSRGSRSFILPEDFLPMVQDVVDTHPGLTFLKEATEFHSRYVHTVIARIYYCVNRSWTGKITIPEIRRSNVLQVISYLEDEEDINVITDYFSYEHFYVIYCKFWELDTDHDLFIDKHDLSQHNQKALSWRIIERIFSGAVTRGRAQKQDRMGYQEFVWFLISEEDKRHPTAVEYWFRCMDLDGDGYLSMYELEFFYEEQLQRMEALGIETLPFSDCLCQMLDMVRPDERGKISLSDLKKCRMTPVFFDTFFNLDKYFEHEQRDPFASHRMDDDGREISDWDRYAAEEYELLIAEEGGGDPQDDMLYPEEDELSMGVDEVLDSNGETFLGGKGTLKKLSPLSATVTNLASDAMDTDDDCSDYADSDDYQY